MFSATVISGNRLWFCGTCTTPARRTSRGLLPVRGSPRCSTRPSRGRSTPLITASSVDLPAPLGPTMHVMAPAGTSKETSCRTSPPPYPAVMPSTVSAYSVIAGRLMRVVAVPRVAVTGVAVVDPAVEGVDGRVISVSVSGVGVGVDVVVVVVVGVIGVRLGAEVGVEHPRVGPDLIRRPRCDDRAGVQDSDLVAQTHHEVHVVLN